MNLMNIYNRLPIFAQNMLVTYQGYLYHCKRYGAEYRRFLEELKSRDHTCLERQKAKQNKMLVDFLIYAAEHSPFYREYYCGIDLSRVRTVEDLPLLPILEKETVRQNLAKIYTLSENEANKSNTSGTTGKSMLLLYTKTDSQRRLAYLDFFKWKHGFVHLKMRQATFNSAKVVPPYQRSKIFWRDNRTTRQRIYSGYHCQGDNVPYYIDNLNHYKPHAIDGYPSSLYELAKCIVYGGKKITFAPIAVFPTAEVLPPNYKELIERAFGCPVRDQYASSEGSPFITECSAGRLHLCMDTGVVETDETGDMLVTCFFTHGTPLIRYRIGDQIEPSSDDSPCPCGCGFPTINRIIGRSQDYLQSLSHGRFPSVYLSLVSEEFRNSVKEMQFIQNRPDTIDIYIVADDNYSIIMDDIIQKKLHYSFGDDMNFVIHHVENIPRERSGKFRMVINNLKQ